MNFMSEIVHKIERFCVYQERCCDEVIQKLQLMQLDSNEIDKIIAHLITKNYLNESRFACSFARGKHRIKFWGKVRIINELKFRNITPYTIDLALKEISAEEYTTTFETLALRNWKSIAVSDKQKKRKKFCDFLLRKGYESTLVYKKLKELEANSE